MPPHKSMIGEMTLRKIFIEPLILGAIISSLGYDPLNYPEPFNCEAEKWHFNHPYVDMSNLKLVVNFENGQKPYFNTPVVI